MPRDRSGCRGVHLLLSDQAEKGAVGCGDGNGRSRELGASAGTALPDPRWGARVAVPNPVTSPPWPQDRPI